MRKNLILSLSAISLIMLSSCSGKLKALSADDFEVTPNPLETQGGQVAATIDGTFPEKYMNKKAVVKVVPQLRFAGQTANGAGETFQGEKVLGNDQVIQYKVGGKYTMKTSFPYQPEMQNSDLYLTFDAKIGDKKVDIPAVKVATGVIATSELYKKTLANAGGCIAPDSFQRVRAQKQEANIKFLINQANLRKNELKNNSVTEFVSMLKKINSDKERLNLKNVEVVAYASPDGGYSFNDKLAGKRKDVSEQYVEKTLKETKTTTDVDAKYTAQDWDGFQQLVAASDLQDKDVILRVLSMYKDPEEREQQIRNMSAAFNELADGILPELRRSRLIINYETVGRSDDQIKLQYAADPSQLSADELLYCATLTDDAAKKEEIYKKAAQLYPSDYRTANNAAAMAFGRGDESTSTYYLKKSLDSGQASPEANANLALMALKDGDLQKAETYVSKATDANGLNTVLGNLSIAKGNYAQAQEYLKGTGSNSAALAQILNKDYASASSTLSNIKNKDGMTYYLQAILAARQGDNSSASSYLRTAVQKDPSLAQYAANDLELAKVSK